MWASSSAVGSPSASCPRPMPQRLGVALARPCLAVMSLHVTSSSAIHAVRQPEPRVLVCRCAAPSWLALCYSLADRITPTSGVAHGLAGPPQSWRHLSCCSGLVGSPQCFALPSAGYSPSLASSHPSSRTRRVTLDQPPTSMTEHAAYVGRPSRCIARRASIAPALSSPPLSDAQACSSDLPAVSAQPKLDRAPQRGRGNARR